MSKYCHGLVPATRTPARPGGCLAGYAGRAGSQYVVSQIFENSARQIDKEFKYLLFREKFIPFG